MAKMLISLLPRFDRVGLLLSALCLLHCLTGLLLVAGIGMGATALLDPAIHEVGLVLATGVAALAIGIGALRHRRLAPVLIAGVGLVFMATAVGVGHGPAEAALTVVGVLLVGAGHLLNLRLA